MSPSEAQKQANYEYVSAKEAALTEVMQAKKIDRHFDIIKELDDRPDLYSFVDVCQKDEIRKDSKAVDELDNTFKLELEEKREQSPALAAKEETNIKISEAMEILVCHFGEIYDWFGEEAMVSRTTKYDDYFHGIDLVVQFGLEEKPVGLAIDVTFSKDTEVVENKIESCVKKALGRDTKSRQIKYFTSEIDETNGALENVIPLVIGFEKDTATDLIESAVEIEVIKRNKSKSELDRKKLKALQTRISTHPAQMAMLEQMFLQLDFLSREAKKCPWLPEEYVENIRTVADAILAVLGKKIDQRIPANNDDPVLLNIRKKLNSMQAR